ncbi:MAG TPA: glycosyltransferase family 9 protein [Bacteroidia bacterium]|nr:glycosyltransferase family 9 protein [Bacteroidia bacterium]HRH07068.1 glycosyltransferase family 9 protein [Bacteroidia bacterium]
MTSLNFENLVSLKGKKWSGSKAPKKILIIRLQAFGDVVITLPYLQSLRNQLPASTQLDFLTRTRMSDIPIGMDMFTNVYALRGGNSVKREFLWFLLMYPLLLMKGYDVVMDLQNHRFSKLIRHLLFPAAWVEFDKESSLYAGMRTKRSIDFCGLAEVDFSAPLVLKKEVESTLVAFNLPTDADWVVLNPAGFFETRNWAKEKYIEFCEHWMKQEKRKTYFLLLGEASMREKATWFEQQLGSRCINLVCKTNALEALQVLSKCKLVVSEDSGLFHMSCAMGVPTIGIYGSTRNDWTNPLQNHTFCFNSSDMECGDCMLQKCIHKKVLCLDRIGSEEVLNKALSLLAKTPQRN